MPSRPRISMTRTEIDAFIASEAHVGVLSTIAPDGGPHAAGMFFVVEGDDILMWTYAKSQKSRNLQRDRRASLLVEAGEPYADLKGVLFRGRVELITEPDQIARIGSLLFARYYEPKTGVSLEDGARASVERQASKRVGIVLPMEKIASWDHSKAVS